LTLAKNGADSIRAIFQFDAFFPVDRIVARNNSGETGDRP
jgi:hypothetical protein